MSRQEEGMIAFFAAVREEVAALRKQISVEETVSEAACHAYRGTYRGRELLLVQTGMGKKRAKAATRFILERYPITTLVSFGFAGALADELEAGDVVLCSEVHCAQEGTVQKPSSYCSDAGVLALATRALERAAVEFHYGSGVTVPQLVLEPEDKKKLGEAFNAHIVDMESYWIAEMASDRRIPFIVIRSVSDTRQERLLPFMRMLTMDGRVRWKEAASYFVRRPQHLIALFHLVRNVRLAQRSLATSIDSLIAGL